MKFLLWCVANWEMLVLILAVILPHIHALLPARFHNSTKLKHVVAILNGISANYGRCRNLNTAVKDAVADSTVDNAAHQRADRRTVKDILAAKEVTSGKADQQ